MNGIMIWELGQDSFSEYSLLKTIHKEYDKLEIKTTELCKDWYNFLIDLRLNYFIENLKRVVDLYFSPGFKITDGKFFWLGESG